MIKFKEDEMNYILTIASCACAAIAGVFFLGGIAVLGASDGGHHV